VLEAGPRVDGAPRRFHLAFRVEARPVGLAFRIEQRIFLRILEHAPTVVVDERLRRRALGDDQVVAIQLRSRGSIPIGYSDPRA
jgi:hypothetical protein